MSDWFLLMEMGMGMGMGMRRRVWGHGEEWGGVFGEFEWKGTAYCDNLSIFWRTSNVLLGGVFREYLSIF